MEHSIMADKINNGLSLAMTKQYIDALSGMDLCLYSLAYDETGIEAEQLYFMAKGLEKIIEDMVKDCE